MKVAVSLPDPLFEAAERLTRTLRLNRSQLYAQALEAFVKAHRAVDVRASLEAVYGHETEGLDPMLEAMQAEALREEW